MLSLTWKQLEVIFEPELKGKWLEIYPDHEFISQTIKKAAYYYDNKEDRPHDRAQWSKAIESFLRTNWERKEAAKGAFKTGKPEFRHKFVKEGPDYIPLPHKEDCDFCHDLRMIRAVSTDGTHETLMLCPCTLQYPDQSDWPLPVWSHSWAPLYSRERCPLEWFKPVELEGKLIDGIEHHVRQWRAKVQIAVEFWKSLKEETKKTEECPF